MMRNLQPRRAMVAIAFALGSVTGIVLLLTRAPLWVYCLVPLAGMPALLFLTLRSRAVPDPVSQVWLPQLATLDRCLPEDPYVALSNHRQAVYVLNQPSQADRLRSRRVQRLGGEMAVVYESGGRPVVHREEREYPAEKGWHVATTVLEPRGLGAELLIKAALPADAESRPVPSADSPDADARRRLNTSVRRPPLLPSP